MAVRKNYGRVGELLLRYDRPNKRIALHAVVQNGSNKRIGVRFTARASYLLWYQLTKLLYPTAAPKITGLGKTTHLTLEQTKSLTTQVRVLERDGDGVQFIGLLGGKEWTFHISDDDARRLWAKLDILIFPFGWQGRESYQAKSE